MRVRITSLFLLCSAAPLIAQGLAPRGGAPLVLFNREIAVLRAPFGGLSAEERVAAIERRLATLPESALRDSVRAQVVTTPGQEARLLFVGDFLVFGLLPGDLDPLGGESLDQAAAGAVERLRLALRARAEARRLPVVLRGAGLALAATLVLLVASWLIGRIRRALLARLEAAPGHLARAQLGPLDLRPHLHDIERQLVRFGAAAVGVGALYLWLTFVFAQFPYTEPWGRALGGAIARTLGGFVRAALGALPGFGMVVLIFLIARYVARLSGGFFARVERGTVSVAWLEPETARATRRIFGVLIWLFAIAVAYPLVPGSSSDAFKGLSVFVGVVASLGSAGVANQIMSGLVVIYSRAIQTGDYVRIGEHEGVVTELGVLSTKLLTRRKEEISIPNALLVGTATLNWSRQAGSEGAIAATSVTIGYDAPWRQVHALLLLAAERTPGVKPSPRPRVLQKALADFFVEYQLFVHIERPDERIPIVSELHAQIQDAFNEYGVQIMSPHFEAQPDRQIVVPKAQWSAAPAGTPDAQPARERAP